jgi:transcriptional regulator with XRE-family HTH domain
VAPEHHTPPTAMNLIGRRLRYAMSALGVTRAELARGANERMQNLLPGTTSLHLSAITKIVNGTRSVRDVELAAFAHTLEIDIQWLLGHGAERDVLDGKRP